MSTIKNTGLGRGLESLIPTGFDPSLLMESSERVQNVFISAIKPNPDQPRRHFDPQSLEELASSIKRYGILQPLIVTPDGPDEYKIIAGERRWRASTIAGLEKVPVIVRAEKDLEQLEIALIENVQRVDLSPLEQAVSIEKLHQQFNMSYDDVSKRLGKAMTTVINIVRLLQLPTFARDALQTGKITEGHARAVLALKDDPAKQSELVKLIQKNGWSVRQAEQFVQTHKKGIKTSTGVKKQMETETPETKKLSSMLSAPVTVYRTAKGGRLEIHFGSDDELTKIINKIQK